MKTRCVCSHHGKVAVACAILAIAASASVYADPQPMPPDAAAHLQKGRTYLDAQLYADAVKEFQAGYLIDQDPEFLYAIAQAERLEGDCKDALVAYRKYIEGTTGATDAGILGRQQNAQSMIQECQGTQAPAATPPPPQPPPVATKPKPKKPATAAVAPVKAPATTPPTTAPPVLTASAPAPAATTPPATTPPVSNNSTNNSSAVASSARPGISTSVWIVGGAAALALATGITGTIIHEHEVSAFNGNASCLKEPTGPIIGGSVCQTAYDHGQTAQTLEILGYAAAGGLAITTGVLYWFSHNDNESPAPSQGSAACAPTLSGLGFSCTGSF
jgi:hypothetical protein